MNLIPLRPASHLEANPGSVKSNVVVFQKSAVFFMRCLLPCGSSHMFPFFPVRSTITCSLFANTTLAALGCLANTCHSYRNKLMR